MPKATNNTFNIIMTGFGGQGLVTLTAILGQAAVSKGYDVKSSELHGLSQRGGSVETHIRFGKKVWSPLVNNGQANLIIGLELLEGFRSLSRGSENTKFLINTYYLPFAGANKEQDILDALEKLPKDKVYLASASENCKSQLGSEVVSGIYMLSYAAHKNLLPLEPASILKAIAKVVPQKYFEINKKAFELAKND